MVKNNPKSGPYGSPEWSSRARQRLGTPARDPTGIADHDGNRWRPLRGGSRDLHFKLALVVVVVVLVISKLVKDDGSSSPAP